MKLEKQESIYRHEVLTKFELYNSLFLTLPFYKIKHTGTLLPFFTSYCERKVSEKVDPKSIIEDFYVQYAEYIAETDQVDLLFRIIQYIERQVVLFDAIEDASFVKTGRSDDAFIMESLLKQVLSSPELKTQIEEKLEDLSLRLVLTAHPTQFYPGPVLGIITDLTNALKDNDVDNIVLLLQQLGKTPFIKKDKPTPVDEAASLAWFLENIFYQVMAGIQAQLDETLELGQVNPILQLGFWPGGDRDGNPNVTTQSTRSVSRMLRTILFRCYYRDFRVIKRRITFRGVETYMDALQTLLYENSFNPARELRNETDTILKNLEAIKSVLVSDHNGLFVREVEDLIRKVHIFGCYFASLDIRQDSSILRKAFLHIRKRLGDQKGRLEDFEALSEAEKIKSISFEEYDLQGNRIEDERLSDTVSVIRYMKEMQVNSGKKAAHRFIISNCQQASDILELMQLFLWAGWKKSELSVDFVPLFETVDDLIRAPKVMETLYTHPVYKQHIASRGGKQVIMLGYSDSTKDGGYMMANWSIYKAKTELTQIARKYEIQLTFFDGRGGPPARGGGKTQRFYASMGKEIANDRIQLTIQGQTISSQYGSFDTAHYNIEQLLQAGLMSKLSPKEGDTLDGSKKQLIEQMAQISHDMFMKLRHHPLFLRYLEKMSPLRFLSEINISSRPVKRNGKAELKLEDLRAISFVTSWSQLKQGIPGFYGVGTALEHMEHQGHWEAVAALYETSGWFKTVIDNCAMAMSKSNFNITSHLQSDPEFGEFWMTMYQEFEKTKHYVLKVSRTQNLMDNYPVDRDSIAMRERIVLPLIIIQHYAMQKINTMQPNDPAYDVYSNLVKRSLYGVVNAGRNLA